VSDGYSDGQGGWESHWACGSEDGGPGRGVSDSQSGGPGGWEGDSVSGWEDGGPGGLVSGPVSGGVGDSGSRSGDRGGACVLCHLRGLGPQSARNQCSEADSIRGQEPGGRGTQTEAGSYTFWAAQGWSAGLCDRKYAPVPHRTRVRWAFLPMPARLLDNDLSLWQTDP
jgi:hypothetical protein